MTLFSAAQTGAPGFIFPSKPWQIFRLTQAAATAIPRAGFQLSGRASWFVTEGSAILACQYCLVKAALKNMSSEISVSEANLPALLQNNDQHKHKQYVALLYELSWTQLISPIFHSALLWQRWTLSRFDFRDTVLADMSPLSLVSVLRPTAGHSPHQGPKRLCSFLREPRVLLPWTLQTGDRERTYTEIFHYCWWVESIPKEPVEIRTILKTGFDFFRQEMEIKANLVVAFCSSSVPFNAKHASNR